MKFIQQKVDDGDCGVAVIAMATGKSYEEVMHFVPPSVIKYGMWIDHARYALQFLTNECWSVRYILPPFFKQLSMYKFPEAKTVYGVYRPEANWAFHYMMCDGKDLYDPLLPDKISLEKARLDYHSGWSIYAEIKR